MGLLWNRSGAEQQTVVAAEQTRYEVGVFIRYNVYNWFPPDLTPEQEIEVGREISRQGREVFLRQYPYLSEKERRQAEFSRRATALQKWATIIVGVIFFGPIIYFGGYRLLVMLLVCTPIMILSVGSMLVARSSYRKWWTT